MNDLKTIFCEFCKKLKKSKSYPIISFSLKTAEGSYLVGLKKLMEDVGKEVFERGYHLSPSQIILLRPDLFSEIVKKLYSAELKSEVLEYYVDVTYSCAECFKSQANSFPEK